MFPLWFHPLSRVVSPIFAFLVVEGLFHTKNKFKYNVRLIGWAIFMELGNKLLGLKGIQVGNNIFLTLALGLTILNMFELSKKKQGIQKIVFILLGMVLIPLGIFTEGGLSVIPFIVITYVFRGKMKKSILAYLVLSIAMFGISYTPYPTLNETIGMLMFNSDFLFILVIPFMFLYNGERGLNNKFSKYLFYVFYPLHLWLLAIIGYLFN
ncbi:TraX family protein [Clostridium lundense]|uniref:TraX family protein n=1 Tax=Clostridium lundense TaxID=319475 RepID=UPI00241835AD|nr:TraX family protein [Clostridium lundense]